MSACGAPAQDDEPIGSIRDDQAVIGGVVRIDGEPKSGAYIRLLGPGGDFVAEVRSSAAGRFRFFAAPGPWIVRGLAARGASGERPVQARLGAAAEIDLDLGRAG